MIARACLALLVLLVVPSCAAPRPATESLPGDFALSLTILGDQDPATQPVWYLLGADNTLHVAGTVRTPATPAPPVVRVLSRAEVEGVWQRVQGLMDSAQAVRISDETAALPTAASLRLHAAVVSVTSGGGTRSVLLRAPEGEGAHAAWAACEGLSRHLALLAESHDPTVP